MSKKELFLRVLLFAGLSAIVALALAGCSSSASPAPTVTVTETQAPQVSKEDAFMASLQSSGNVYLENMSRADALKIAHNTCDLLNQGYTLYDIVEVLANSGNFTTADEQQAVGYILGAGIQVFCPEYSYQIDNL